MYEKYFDHNYKFCDLTDNYLEQTAQLLNQEWPRSLSIRCHSLKSTITTSSDLTLPISLIIIYLPTNKVIGHASISSIAVISDNINNKMVEFENLAFLQSVIIDRELRGKGLGKKLMLLCENYLVDYGKQEINSGKNINIDYGNMFLTTKDKQAFYESLGYKRIEPIKFYTVKITKCTEILKRLYSSNSKEEISQETEAPVKAPMVVLSAPPPPPPPPPMPTFKTGDTYQMNDPANELKNLTANWFKKCLF